MKRIIVIALATLLTIVSFSSCSTLYGVDLGKRVQLLELGMNKQEVVDILGKDYYIEAASQVPEGRLEVLHFHSLYYSDYLLYFLNGELDEFHRYIAPPTPEMKVVKED